jgi:hypothetical protein
MTFLFGLLVGNSDQAWAAPSIAVVSPAAGSKVAPPTTIKVAYAGNGLDLATLKILVRGADWTSRFAITATDATAQLTTGDGLVAGPVGIEASIADSTAVRSTTTSEFKLAPSLTAIAPLIGRVDDILTVTGLGLDPTKERNQLVFLGAGSPTVLSPFIEVSEDLHSGAADVPGGARSGAVYLRVNEVDSLQPLFFYVRSILPKCGDVKDFDLAANGDTYAVFALKNGAGTVPREAGCPAPTSTNALTYALLIKGDGTMVKLIESTSTLSILGSAVDKSGAVGAFLTRSGQSGTYKWTVRWWKNRAEMGPLEITGLSGFFSGCCSANFPMDFDRDNRLYFMADSNRLARVTLPIDGPPATQAAIELVGPHHGYSPVFAIGCDNRAYVAGHDDVSAPPNYLKYRLSQIDLETGAELKSTEVPQRYLVDMDVSCDTRKVYLSQFSHAYGQLDVEVVEASIDVDDLPFKFEVKLERFAVNDDPLVRVGPDGTLYSSDWDRSTGYQTRLGGGRTVFALDLPKIPACAGTGPLAFCPRISNSLKILPSPKTTRWRAQRSDAPMKVTFTGPTDLDLNTVTLEVTAPQSIGVYTPLRGEVTAAGGEYSFEWLGPWTYPATEGDARLPSGNYTLRVRAKTTAESPEIVSVDPVVTSLVEVTAVAIQALAGGAVLDANPGVGLHPEEPTTNRVARPGGGFRIFAEADGPQDAIPAPVVKDTVGVQVTISPMVPQEVSIELRLMDVDDPDSAPIDKDGDADTDAVNDNYGLGSIPATLIVPANEGTGSIVVTLSHKPGDNFRVAASTSRAWVNSLAAVQASRVGAIRDGTGVLLVEKKQVSEMITVWRHLNLEIDSMASPPEGSNDDERNFVEGSVREIQTDNNGSAIRLFVDPASPPGMDGLRDGSPDLAGRAFFSKGNGRFENGTLRIGSTQTPVGPRLSGNGIDYVEGKFEVRATLSGLNGSFIAAGIVISGKPSEGVFRFRPTTAGWPSVPAGSLILDIGGTTWQIPAGGLGPLTEIPGGFIVADILAAPGKELPFRLTDDDAAVYPFSMDLTLVGESDSPEANAFAPAYIVPRLMSPPGAEKTAPFNRNVAVIEKQVGVDSPEHDRDIADGRQFVGDSKYWVSYLQAAFQEDLPGDHEPNEVTPFDMLRGVGPVFGLTSLGEPASQIFSETIRDAGGEPLTVAHEIGHQFGLPHITTKPFTLMTASSNDSKPFFSANEILLIRISGGKR